MAKQPKTYTYDVNLVQDENGNVFRTNKPKVVEVKQLPRHLRSHSPESVHTFTESPIARLFGRPKKGKK